MIATLLVLLILSFLVVIHELGHFWAAKWAKVKIFEFGIGYPPKAIKLFSWQGTEFTLNWIPFGGFVRMAGEDSASDDILASEMAETTPPPTKKTKGKPQKTVDLSNLYDRSTFQRLVVICAGATINIVFGILIFMGITAQTGIPTELSEARIASTMPNSPAAAAQLPSQVTITALQAGSSRVEVANAQEVQEFITQHRGETVVFETTGSCSGLQCGSARQSFELYIRLPEETPANEGAVGIVFETVVFLRYPWYEMPFRATWFALQQAAALTVMILEALGSMMSSLFTQGKVPAELSGPVGIVHEFQKSGMASQGPMVILSFMAVLSLNLGVMNMLPIPALDGGRVVFIILEKILGRPRTSQVEHYAHLGGYVFLLSLIVLITLRDIWRIFV